MALSNIIATPRSASRSNRLLIKSARTAFGTPSVGGPLMTTARRHPNESRTQSIKHILSDGAARVLPDQERIDGRWCHVVDVPGAYRVWVALPEGDILRRDCFVGPAARLLSRCELKDYRNVASVVRLPWLLTRTIPVADVRAIFSVRNYAINSVRDEQFSFTPPAGTLVKDRDTDEAYQVPGGLRHLDEICDRGAALSRPRPTCARYYALGGGLCGSVLAAMALRRTRARWRRRHHRQGVPGRS